MKTFEIIILGSGCTVSDWYLEEVKNIAESMGIDYTLRKTQTDIDAERFGVKIFCLKGNCPGCHAMTKVYPDTKKTPALAVNGRLLFHSEFPGETKIREALENFSSGQVCTYPYPEGFPNQ